MGDFFFLLSVGCMEIEQLCSCMYSAFANHLEDTVQIRKLCPFLPETVLPPAGELSLK